MIELAWPWLLLALPLPLLVYFLIPPARAPVSALPVPFFACITADGAATGGKRECWHIALAGLAWLCLVLAASRPQWLGEARPLPVAGTDIMLAVDISGSMKEQDMRHNGRLENRLATVKRVATDFIRRRDGDRVGLILFGTQAYIQAPLTFDRETVITLLDEAAIGIAGEKTAIGNAIGLALKRLQQHQSSGTGNPDSPDSPNSPDNPDNEADKILILLTDGANTAGDVDPVKAATIGQQVGLRIYAIGVGAPTQTVNTLFGPRVMATELDEDVLRQIAELTDGRYFRATDPASLQAIYALIDQFEPVVEEARYLIPRTELFHWLLAAAVFFALLPGLALSVSRVVRGPPLPLTSTQR